MESRSSTIGLMITLALAMVAYLVAFFVSRNVSHNPVALEAAVLRQQLAVFKA